MKYLGDTVRMELENVNGLLKRGQNRKKKITTGNHSCRWKSWHRDNGSKCKDGLKKAESRGNDHCREGCEYMLEITGLDCIRSPGQSHRVAKRSERIYRPCPSTWYLEHSMKSTNAVWMKGQKMEGERWGEVEAEERETGKLALCNRAFQEKRMSGNQYLGYSLQNHRRLKNEHEILRWDRKMFIRETGLWP